MWKTTMILNQRGREDTMYLVLLIVLFQALLLWLSLRVVKGLKMLKKSSVQRLEFGRRREVHFTFGRAQRNKKIKCGLRREIREN